MTTGVQMFHRLTWSDAIDRLPPLLDCHSSIPTCRSKIPTSNEPGALESELGARCSAPRRLEVNDIFASNESQRPTHMASTERSASSAVCVSCHIGHVIVRVWWKKIKIKKKKQDKFKLFSVGWCAAAAVSVLGYSLRRPPKCEFILQCHWPWRSLLPSWMR